MDDVSSRILEGPEPPPRRRRSRRWAVALTGGVLAAGILAPAPSALTGSAGEPAPAAKPRSAEAYKADGRRHGKRDGKCDEGRRDRRGSSAASANY